jgi:TolB-like protein
MRSGAGAGLMLLACTATPPLSAQAGPVVVAVLPFEDRGSYGQDKEVFRALELGIPATLESELRGHPGLRVVERSQVAQARPKQPVARSGQLDAATAAKVAKQLGARYAVTGSFADFYGKFRLDARVVDAESGQILKVVSNDDPRRQDRADLYRIIQMVAHRVLEVTSPDALRPGADSEGAVVPTEAITQFSLGLLYETQGNKSQAAEHYQRALSTHPNYPDAQEGLRRSRSS